MGKGATKADAIWVIRTLRGAGHQALLAGGCVRDMLLGRRPADYDVATDAQPEQVRRLFRRVLMVGAKFGVAMVLRGTRTVEVATFRSDVSYSDGRRPDAVKYADPKADAERRDFTVNGMFHDPLADRVLDYVGGRTDLKVRLIRAIGEPNHRFDEDYLRMLRAVRFAVRLDFQIEPATAEAIRVHADRIDRISGERIRDELEKMLAGPNGRRAMSLLAELGLAEHVFGSAVSRPDVWSAGMRRLDRLAGRRDPVLSLAALLGDAGAAHARALCSRWGASNAMRGELAWLVRHLPDWTGAMDLCLANFKRILAHRAWEKLLALWHTEEHRLTGDDALGRRIARRAGRIDPEQISPPPLVTGQDVIAMGVPEGPRLGQLVRRAYDLQLGEELRTRKEALAAVRDWLGDSRQ